MQTPSNYNVVIFLNSTFYQKEIDQLIEPFTNGQKVLVYLFYIDSQNKIDLSSWESKENFDIVEITSEFTPLQFDEDIIIIDALFGFDITKPLSGGFAAVVRLINHLESTVVSIGAPSGLLPDDNTLNNSAHIVKANYTLLLGEAPIACYFAENQVYLGEWSVVNNLPNITESTQLPTFTTTDEIKEYYKPRKRFSHKGNYGHGLLIAGSLGMAGACTLAAQAALKTGIGLLTIHSAQCNRTILQTNVPEAMVQCDTNETFFSDLVIDTTPFQGIAIGPGLGMDDDTNLALHHLLIENSNNNIPIVLDADGINLLANNSGLLYNGVKGAILTPHPIELERLVGKCNNSYIRLTKAIELAKKAEVYIVLKGAYSILIMPDGSYQFNSTGNSGMATGGSGDVLTGIILALLSQGYNKREAIVIANYVHGMAGDIAIQEVGEISLTASDIVNNLPKAWIKLNQMSQEETF